MIIMMIIIASKVTHNQCENWALKASFQIWNLILFIIVANMEQERDTTLIFSIFIL